MIVFFSFQQAGILFYLKPDEKFQSLICYWSETFMKQKKKSFIITIKIYNKNNFFHYL